MQTQITRQCVIKEETEELDEKPLHRPPSSNRSTRQSVGIHGLARDPSSLIYSLYLSPPSSYSNKAFQNRVFSSSSNPATSSMLHLPSLASSNAIRSLSAPHHSSQPPPLPSLLPRLPHINSSAQSRSYASRASHPR